jgi:hypothetical protein
MRITRHADDETAKEIRAKIKEADGHCPCVLKIYRNKDTLCMCKKFLDSPAGTICDCGMYKKLED